MAKIRRFNRIFFILNEAILLFFEMYYSKRIIQFFKQFFQTTE